MIRTFLTVLASCVAASALHELTHYAVAKALGRQATFVPREWAVYFEDGDSTGTRAIQGAPLFIGLVGGAVAALTLGVATWLLPAWWLFTLHGALTNDFGGHVFDLPSAIFSKERT